MENPTLREVLNRIVFAVESIDRRLSQDQAEYLSIQQAAEFSSLSATKIRRAIKSRQLPASDIGTAAHPHYRIAKTDLYSWMEKNKGGNPVPPKSELAGLVKRYFPDA